jgi:hypothetical protein
LARYQADPEGTVGQTNLGAASGKLQAHAIALPEQRSVESITLGDDGCPGRISRKAELGSTPGDGLKPCSMQKAQKLFSGSQHSKTILLLAGNRKEHRPSHTGERKDQAKLKKGEAPSQPG